MADRHHGKKSLGALPLGLLISLGTIVPGLALNLGAAPAFGGTCASQCGDRPIQFQPGVPLAIQVINLTGNVVEVQEDQGGDPFPLPPGRMMQLDRLGNTTVNSSVLFWDTLGLGLRVKLIKTDDRTLRVELHPNYEPPGDRSIYLRDDGGIDVL